MDQFARKMISDQQWEDKEVDRQIISMLHDAVVVGMITSGSYRGIFFDENNEHTQENGVAGDQELKTPKSKWVPVSPCGPLTVKNLKL